MKSRRIFISGQAKDLTKLTVPGRRSESSLKSTDQENNDASNPSIRVTQNNTPTPGSRTATDRRQTKSPESRDNAISEIPNKDAAPGSVMKIPPPQPSQPRRGRGNEPSNRANSPNELESVVVVRRSKVPFKMDEVTMSQENLSDPILLPEIINAGNREVENILKNDQQVSGRMLQSSQLGAETPLIPAPYADPPTPLPPCIAVIPSTPAPPDTPHKASRQLEKDIQKSQKKRESAPLAPKESTPTIPTEPTVIQEKSTKTEVTKEESKSPKSEEEKPKIPKTTTPSAAAAPKKPAAAPPKPKDNRTGWI